MTQTALDGLKIVELGDFISAPLCVKILADLGAEVIKIETPRVGDESRRYGPFPNDVPDGERSGLFLYMNANKRGVTLDPHKATGKEIFHALIADADVLVENLQPDAYDALGLDYDKLSEINPGLVMTSISSFGRSGPYASYKGYDLTSWHGSGVAHRWLGEPGQMPLQGAWYHANHWGGIFGATATLIALTGRDLTGEGQHVDVAETDCLTTQILGYRSVTEYYLEGLTESRQGSAVQGGSPSGLFRCKDGYIYIMALEEHHWEGVKAAMGHPEWANDTKFQGPVWDRTEHAPELARNVQPWLDAHTKEELFTVLQANRVPAGPLYNAGDIMHHPHLAARGFTCEVEHPLLGRLPMPGKPYDLPATPWRIRHAAPQLGQHNTEIYAGDLGFSMVDLTDLRRTGII